MALDARQFRQVMGRFATGVTVVTLAEEERLYGITVNSFTSVSLDPMLVLVCIDKNASAYHAFRPGRGFTVNILSEAQVEMSNLFADKEIQDKFARVGYRLGSQGAPILDNAIAYLECRITQAYDGGDHTIFLGEVQDAQIGSDEQPLLFYEGKYCALKNS